MNKLSIDLQLKIMSYTDPKSFSYMMVTCKTFFNLFLPINKIISGLASHDQAINIKTLHYIINNVDIFRGHFSKISSLLDAFCKNKSSTENINILMLIDMFHFLCHLDMQPEIANLDLNRIANTVFHKLYNGLVLDYILQKCLYLKNMPNNLTAVIDNIQRTILTIDSRNDNAGFCDQDSIIFYTAIFYLDIDRLSKNRLMNKIINWLSIQERSSNYEIHSFKVMAANMRCLGYEFDSESRAKFSSEIIRNSRNLSNANYSRDGGPICLEDNIAYSIIRIFSIESLSVEINTMKVKIFYPFRFLESLLENLCSSYVRYLLIYSGQYFIDYMFSETSACIGAAGTLASIVSKLSNSNEVKVALIRYVSDIRIKDTDIHQHLGLYILKFNIGINEDYCQLSAKIVEIIKSKIKTFSFDTRLILKDVFSEAQRLEIERFGLECYKKCTNSLQYESFLSYLLSNSVSGENAEIARQLITKYNLEKLACYPKDLYSLYDYFRYLKFQDDETVQNYIDHVVAQVKLYLNPKYKSLKNINEAHLSEVLSTLKHYKYHHLIKSEYQTALIDTINHSITLEEPIEAGGKTKLSSIYYIIEKYVQFFNDDKEYIISIFLDEIIRLIFNFNLTDESLYSERYYPNSIIRVLFCNFQNAIPRVIDECWLPFLVRYQPIQLSKVIAQISSSIKYIDDMLFKEKLIPTLFKLLAYKFVSNDFLANDTYKYQIKEIYQCLSQKSHLLTFEEICIAGSRPSPYQQYFTFLRAGMEICHPVNIICDSAL